MNPTSSSTHCDGSLAENHMDDWLFLCPDAAEPLDQEVCREDQEAAEKSKFKSKLVSVWNSVKYGWNLKQKSKFSKSSPLIMFGKSYNLREEGEKEDFHRSFVSLLWFTYRRGFPQLAGCSLTTDSGWGCVLRTGQMLLARGLNLHMISAEWTWSTRSRVVKDDMDLLRFMDNVEMVGNVEDKTNMRCRNLSLGSLLDRPDEAKHRKLVSWFADTPKAPFGIHQLVELGKSSGKKAGDWYGPSIVAHILRKAVSASADLPNLAVYVAQDCTIYLQDVRRLCERPLSWKSVIILVPVRLGGQDLNPSYITCVKKLLKLECCIGIIGGKPRHSLFFIGFQDDHLLYLDPHYCQPTVNMAKGNFPLESFHCKQPRKMNFSRMDPSCTIGFYAKGQKEFESLCTSVNEAVSTSAETYPMFIFAEERSREDSEHNTPTNITYIQRKSGLERADTSSSMDEFVLL